MDFEALRNSPIGQIVPIRGFDQQTGTDYDHWAFLPDPLPQELQFESETWLAVLKAETALARLGEAARLIPEPALLRRPSIRREAQSTSALEGTFAPFEQVLESDLDDPGELSAEIREIVNYIVAAEEGFGWPRDRRFTPSTLGALQLTLVRGTQGEHSDSGGIRDRQVLVGARSSSIADSRFVPPPPGDQLRAGLENLLAWINDPPAAFPCVVRTALAHYQFETLHPFSDGNGRIGRLLIVLQLLRDGALVEPTLVVSPWFEARREQYQDGLLALSRSGSWDPWIRFFAEGVASAADGTRQRIDQLTEWKDSALARVRAANVSGVAERLAGELIGEPYLTAGLVAERYEVTPQAAMNALRRLVALGLMQESRRRNRATFRAADVVQILSR